MSTEHQVEEVELWAQMIRDAQIMAITHGTAFVKFSFEDQTIHVELLQPHAYMSRGLINTMETKQ